MTKNTGLEELASNFLGAKVSYTKLIHDELHVNHDELHKTHDELHEIQELDETHELGLRMICN